MESKTQVVIAGTIESIGELKSFSGGKFRKQELVIKSGDGKYPNYYPCTFKNEEIGQLQGWNVGDEVVVKGYVNGNKWDKKDESGKIVKTMYFLEVDAKSIVTAAAAESDEVPSDADAAADGEEVVQDDIPW